MAITTSTTIKNTFCDSREDAGGGVFRRPAHQVKGARVQVVEAIRPFERLFEVVRRDDHRFHFAVEVFRRPRDADEVAGVHHADKRGLRRQ